MLTRILITIMTCAFCSAIHAQDDLLDMLDHDVEQKDIKYAFKALQVVNMQSTKMPKHADLYFVVSHRFGSLKDGVNTFFGLDNATTKIGFIYGIQDWISVGITRHTLNKAYEGSLKYRLANENDDAPVTIVGYQTVQINSQLDKDAYPKLTFENRLTYVSQLLISRSVSKNLTAELIGSYLHKNIYEPEIENKNQFSIGAGGRLKLNKRLSLTAEYMYSDQPSFYNNPLSLGLNIETGGHVFQLLFTNSQGMTESTYLTNASGDWGKGDVYFGFNLYRVF